MKRLLSFALSALLALATLPDASAGRQDAVTLRGSVVDAAGAPVGFATTYLSRSDGSVVIGTTAGEDGRFSLAAAPGEYTLTVSLVGYRDASQSVRLAGTQMELPPIRLEEDTQLLGEAVVQAVMPKTKLTGEGLQTSVHGSVLENAGTARDVLGKVPGLIKGQDGLEVIGKGAPQVYINGRRLTDASELDRLLSHEIQSVEVINNPGAQYDASVRAVVRIRTIRRQGEGFGFNVNLADEQSLRKKEGNDPSASFNANYRKGGVDVFGGIGGSRYSNRQTSEITHRTNGANAFRQEGSILGDGEQRTLNLNGGVNWQIADNHFTGFKLDWTRTGSSGLTTLDDEVFLNGVLLDHLFSTATSTSQPDHPVSWGANAYYNGQAGKLGIDFNFDHYRADASEYMHTDERSTVEDAEISTRSTSGNRFYAAKLVLSYPVWRGMLQLGTEETFSRRSDDYSLTGAAIPASSSRVREDNIAAFVNYAFAIGQVGQMSAGLRYEHVNYAYDDLLGQGSFSRRYDNYFPSLSFAGLFGPVQAMLSYSARTIRPDFSMLSSAIQYNNRYTLQSGNAALQPQTYQSFSATSLWKFLTFVVNYNRVDHMITTWSELYNDEGAILVQPRNLEKPMRMLSAFVSATPTIGPWTLSYTAGVQQQWLTIDAKDPSQASGYRRLTFNDRPLWIAQLNNTLSLKKGWQLELGGEYHSPGYSQNALVTNHFFNLTAAVQKTLLADGSLVLRLEGRDLAGLGNNHVFADFGGYSVTQSNIFDTQRIVLSVRYRFNTAASKYKGTGAGNDTRDRMK